QVAGFLAELERLGLARDTYVVLLSDHGEAFGEHGVVGHGLGAQQEQLHVPLIVRGPDVPRGATVQAPASIVDVAPTILELVGITPPDAEGRSLAEAFRGGVLDAERPLSFAWLDAGARGLRQGRWKLIDGGPTNRRLYDLPDDPRERRPIVDDARLA